MTSSFIAVVLILLALSLPIIIRMFFKQDLFVLFFILTPFFQVVFMANALVIDSFVTRFEQVGYIIFYLILVIATLELLFLLISPAIKSIKIVLNYNNKNPLKEIGIYFLLVFALLLVPNIVFSFIYVFWGIVEVNHLSIGIWDALYFCFSINYSLPLSGSLEEFQNVINYSPMLRAFQIMHILTSKIYEIVIIAIIVSKILKILEGRSK